MLEQQLRAAGMVIAPLCTGLYRDEENTVRECGRATGHPPESCGPALPAPIQRILDTLPTHTTRQPHPDIGRDSHTTAMLAELIHTHDSPHLTAVALALAATHDTTGSPVAPTEIQAAVDLAESTIRRWLNTLVTRDLAWRTRDSRFIPRPSPSAAGSGR